MRDRIFLDTNIIVYSLLQNGSQKHGKALAAMGSVQGTYIFISTQVINELYVTLLKHNLQEKDIEIRIRKILSLYNVTAVTLSIVELGWKLRKKYACSYWDSLIIASALDSNCSVLYTEDLRHGQIIEKKLKIINPFSGKV